MEPLARDNPTVAGYQSQVGATLSQMATLDMSAHRFLKARDRLKSAIDFQKRALAAHPSDPLFRQFLKYHFSESKLVAVGLEDAEMVEEARQGLAEVATSDPASAPLNNRFAAVVGDMDSVEVEELLTLGEFGYDTMRYSAATRMFAAAIEQDPLLADDRNTQVAYNAACCAALASAGEGLDEPIPDDAGKALLRGQALAWLQAELDRWESFAQMHPEQSETLEQTLLHWQKDPDLRSIREPDKLSKLSENERRKWEGLWQRVNAR